MAQYADTSLSFIPKHADALSAEKHHLALLRKGDCAIVTGLAETDDDEQTMLKMRLLELGFAPGEQIRVVAESFPGRDPMAVRIGNTTFALRRREAAMIYVMPRLPL